MTDTLKTKEELITEISELRTRLDDMSRQVEYLSEFDVLTDLPNRNLFMDRLMQTLISSKRNSNVAAVIYIGVDRFKLINESMGLEAGDFILRGLSKRLLSCVRDSDTVSRINGDEFAIVLSKIAKEEDGVVVARKILETFREPYVIEGKHALITASIGISLFPADGETPEVLVKNANTAMQLVKERDGNNYNFFTSSMNEAVTKRITLETSLRKAIEKGDELTVFYQPQIDVKTRSVIGMEALIRWRHPEKGLISPLDFIPLAEETGLIVPIGEWVLQEACRKNKEWIEAGFPDMRMGVNLSMRQFKQKDLVKMIERTLVETGLDPKLLELELTESTAMKDASGTIKVITDLKSMGLHVSIDDFGTGYSSLSYLRDLPISTLKIDQSFVRNMSKTTNDTAIVKAIINLAHSLSLNVIAEGVETEVDFSILNSLNCNEVQGYLFSKPIPDKEFTELLKKFNKK